MNFAPDVWLSPQLDSGNGFEAMCCEGANFYDREFPHISQIDDPSISLADVEGLQYQDGWNNSNYAEFSDLWNSNAP